MNKNINDRLNDRRADRPHIFPVSSELRQPKVLPTIGVLQCR